MSAPSMIAPVFQHDVFVARRKVLVMFGGAFHLYDGAGNTIGFFRQKAFKLKEDIRLFSDEAMTHELLAIHARAVLDISAVYDVIDKLSGQKVGALKRRGLKSMLQDEWAILDANDREIGMVQEDSTAMAILRRFVANLVPQTYNVTVGRQLVGEFKQHFNPFVLRMTVDFSHDRQKKLDRRLGLAAVVLLLAIEGRQD